MSATKSQKRKGDGVFTDNPSNVVVVKVEPVTKERAEDMKQKLRSLRQKYTMGTQGTDPILEQLGMVGHDYYEPKEKLNKNFLAKQAELDRLIEQEKAACQAESGDLAEMSAKLQSLIGDRDQLVQDVDEMDQRQLDLQEKIALHQQETEAEMGQISSVEEERKREVPRLKHQISLFASTTGIKWDYSKGELLAGSVAIPDHYGFELFSIDPRDYDEVEVANRLWALIEGKQQ